MNETDKSQQSGSPQDSGKDKILLTTDLTTLAHELKGEENWQKIGRGSRTIFKSETLRIVLNVMQAGSEIKPHQAPGPISVQVVEGRIRFITEEQSVELAKGQMLTLQAHVRHSVEALEEAAFLLTVSPLPSRS
ncbi:cupin domain-containing protein [Pontibacter sp. HSC-36F09]|uniref:cupin domain-containing protein n=1 Tax=Pontibacter sp. HSC-36F09 TaxID=2910966 RepID=UPI0020A1B92B|nr:cupin domain-containing protein [Pontibacter sp. HSC-36F09]MCP2045511.1 quercetin dioxygenase-like cupin family protein [Pontibacter sp. HSC-36F09]